LDYTVTIVSDVVCQAGVQVMLATEYLTSITAFGGGFFIGVPIGLALKKVPKLAALVVALFFAGIAYIQYQQILNIN